MGQVGDLIGAQGTTATGVLGPAEHPGLEEGAIDDQLLAALEQIEQAYLALGSVELVLLVHGQPRHPPAFGGQRVTGAGEGLLLHEELLACGLPLPLRHDRGRVHRELPFPVFLVALFACCHLISPLSLSLTSVGRATSPGIRHGLRCESCELALESSACARAPSLRDGLGRGIGENLLFAFSDPSKIPAAADSVETFGILKPRFLSASTGPRTTTWTDTPWPAKTKSWVSTCR